MEDTSGRATNPVGFLRKGSGIALRNQSNDVRPCPYTSRSGKTTNLNPSKARWAEKKEKPRFLSEPFHSSGYTAPSASSSKAPVRKYYEEKHKQPFLSEAGHAESSNRRSEVRRLQRGKKAVIFEDAPPYSPHYGSSSSTITVGGLREERDLEVLDTLVSSDTSARAVNSIVRGTASSTKPLRQKDKEEFSSGTPQGVSTFIHRRTGPQNSTVGVKSSSASGTASSGLQRRGLKNLGCTSISDVLPSGCSLPDSVRNRRVDVTKKRASDGESSSRSRGTSGQANLVEPPATYLGSSGSRARAAEQSASQQAARYSSSSSVQDSVDPVRTRRPSTQHSWERMPGERADAIVYPHETVTRVHHPEMGHFPMNDIAPQRLPRPFHAELPHAIYSSNRQDSIRARRRSSSRTEESPPQMSHGLFGERDVYRRINMEGFAEVLLALDRIEHHDELTYEQLLVLETNLLLSGLGLHDQHQDMRLDIDNMSYEELLALEDQIGSVSTALSEEQFTKFVKCCVYKTRNSDREVNKIVVDDVKCSICQEEYIEGEEVGRMQCEHQYHVFCIHEWLRQKNWCPICKASAIPSEMNKGSA